MGTDSDDEDFVFYGTPLQDESDGKGGFSASKTLKDPGVVRSVPVHQQEAADDQGRKRFHGAFTGGYSAGYYNTVGSKVGCACRDPRVVMSCELVLPISEPQRSCDEYAYVLCMSDMRLSTVNGVESRMGNTQS